MSRNIDDGGVGKFNARKRFLVAGGRERLRLDVLVIGVCSPFLGRLDMANVQFQ